MTPEQIEAFELPEGFETWSLTKKQEFIDELKYNWKYWARPSQLPPNLNWDGWLILAGRGFGKTRTGAEWVKQKMIEEPGCRVAVVGMTIGAAREVCFKGDSGLLSVIPPRLIPPKGYNSTNGQLKLTNGSIAYLYSGQDPEKLRGPQHHYAWIDELAAYQYARDTFDNLIMGLRLGRHPQWVVTTTPKPTPLIIDLVNQASREPERVVITSGSTFENKMLPESTLNALRDRYENTTLGRQELYADLILEDPSALWKQELIDNLRVDPVFPEDPNFVEIVVAVDPSMAAEGERESETGIIVVGRHKNGQCYILEDASLTRPTPDAWGRRVIEIYHKWKANKVVAEVNQGFDLVTNLLSTLDPHMPLKKVYATRGGKFLRAEPIAALYEQGKVHHCGMFLELEIQMRSWCVGKPSPDRLDAMVWGVTEIMLGGGIADVFSPMQLPRIPRMY